ncbi:MAG: hypothetical protein RJA37_889 [Verrucomicrobiota bacterium]|jgi:hypothetical protein
MTKQAGRAPQFILLGAAYGLLWGLVALTVMKLCLNAGRRELL